MSRSEATLIKKPESRGGKQNLYIHICHQRYSSPLRERNVSIKDHIRSQNQQKGRLPLPKHNGKGSYGGKWRSTKDLYVKGKFMENEFSRVSRLRTCVQEGALLTSAFHLAEGRSMRSRGNSGTTCGTKYAADQLGFEKREIRGTIKGVDGSEGEAPRWRLSKRSASKCQRQRLASKSLFLAGIVELDRLRRKCA